MSNETKTIRRVGNGTGILLDNDILSKSKLKLGDKLEYKCSKNKIVFKKNQEEE